MQRSEWGTKGHFETESRLMDTTFNIEIIRINIFKVFSYSNGRIRWPRRLRSADARLLESRGSISVGNMDVCLMFIGYGEGRGLLADPTFCRVIPTECVCVSLFAIRRNNKH